METGIKIINLIINGICLNFILELKAINQLSLILNSVI